MTTKHSSIQPDTIAVIRSILYGHCSNGEIEEIVRRVNGWEKIVKALNVASRFISSSLGGQNSETLKFINEVLTEAGKERKES